MSDTTFTEIARITETLSADFGWRCTACRRFDAGTTLSSASRDAENHSLTTGHEVIIERRTA